jgi:alpha-N-arabinofuranosidase
MEWDRTVLEVLGDQADYVSLHRYVDNRANDTPDFLALSNAIDRQIEEMDAVCRFAQAKRRSAKRAYLCFDEWNVWYKNMQMNGEGRRAPHLIEEVYNLEDALVVALFLNSFVRHADVVKIANLAQVVNVIAPVLTRGNELLRQSIFYAFLLYAKRREGVSLRPAVEGPSYEGRRNGRVHTVDASAVWNEPLLHVFLVNRSLSEAAPVAVSLADRAIDAVECAECVTGADAKAANSFERPFEVTARPFEAASTAGGAARLELPPLSAVGATLRLR